MTPEVLAALVSAVGLVLAGVLAELVRNRRRTDRVVAEVTANSGSSLRDAVNRVETDVREIRACQNRHTARIATVEAVLNERRAHGRR